MVETRELWHQMCVQCFAFRQIKNFCSFSVMVTKKSGNGVWLISKSHIHRTECPISSEIRAWTVHTNAYILTLLLFFFWQISIWFSSCDRKRWNGIFFCYLCCSEFIFFHIQSVALCCFFVCLVFLLFSVDWKLQNASVLCLTWKEKHIRKEGQ